MKRKENKMKRKEYRKRVKIQSLGSAVESLNVLVPLFLRNPGIGSEPLTCTVIGGVNLHLRPNGSV
jgi:hypothetical protein